MRSPRRARAAAAVASLGLLLVLSAMPGVPIVAAAAGDGLDLRTATTYTFLPDEGRISVVIDVRAKNTVATTISGGVVRRSYFEAIRLSLQPEAANVRSTMAGRRLTTSIVDRKGDRVVTVRLPDRLYVGRTANVRVTFDLPGGPPRSASEIRAGRAFTSFYAWVNGDRASVAIVLPDSFEANLSGEAMTEGSAPGKKVYRADGITDTARWYVIVDADSETSLRDRPLTVRPGERLLIRSWPEDGEWLDRVQDRLKRGLPVLDDLIGLPWPVAGQLNVTEVYTPLLEGYAGIYHPDAQGIEISEDLDDLTILHEASHAWFNEGLFAERWIGEGLADTYATMALARIGIHSPAAVSYPRDSKAAFALNDWPPLTRIDDDTTGAREDYGYETSFRVMSTIVSAVGEDAMRKVFAAAAAHEIAYVGALPVEHRPGVADWHVLLDDLQERGHVSIADYEFLTYVVGSADVDAMKARSTARTAYAGLVADGRDWAAPYAVRSPMASWDFAEATDEIATAHDILDIRDRIAAAGEPLGLDVPAGLRTGYETAAPDDFPAVLDAARTDLAAGEEIAGAAQRVAAPRDPIAAIGLLGVRPEAALAAAESAYRSGRMDEARRQAAQAVDWLDQAPEFGRRGVGAAIGAEAVIVVLLGVLVVGIRRSRRVSTATLPSQSSPVATGADEGADPIVSEPMDTPHDEVAG